MNKPTIADRENRILRARLQAIIALCDLWGRKSQSGLQKIVRIAEGYHDEEIVAKQTQGAGARS